MALVPHKITALAISDADGTDGKNIVAGAVVSLYDTDGNAVILFDDENGSNGSTVKQTDNEGVVVVYVEEGEYDEEVNGSTRRRVLVGSVNNKRKDEISLDELKVPVSPEDCSSELKAAIEYADANKLTLVWNNNDYTHSSVIAAAAVNDLSWRTEGANLAYTGSDVLYGLIVNLASGKANEIKGNGISYDAGGSCHTGVLFNQPLDDKVGTFYAENISVTNTEMQPVAQSSSGLQVQGGFGKVELVKPRATNIKMRVGSGVVGSSGVTGILVNNQFLVNGAYPLLTEIRDAYVDGVYSLDDDYKSDMDGIGIFANPENDVSNGYSSAFIYRPTIKACRGRNIKMQLGYSEIHEPKSVLNSQPNGGIANPAYDFQLGSGKLLGGTHIIDGVNAYVICRFGGGASSLLNSSLWEGGAIILQNGGTIEYPLMQDVGAATQSSASARNISVTGSIPYFGWMRTNGFDIDRMELSCIIMQEVTTALVLVSTRSGGADPYRGIVIADKCANIGAEVPIVRKGVSPTAAKAIADVTNCTGFLTTNIVGDGGDNNYSGISLAKEVYYPPLGTDPLFTGTEKHYSIFAQSGVEYTLPAHGYDSSYVAEVYMCRSRNEYAKFVVDNFGFVEVFKGVNVEISNTEPVSGNLRIWRDGSTLKVKNGSTGGEPIMFKFMG